MKWFKVACCGTRRGLFPGEVLVCPRCDYDHSSATIIPNDVFAKDVPESIPYWWVTTGDDD